MKRFEVWALGRLAPWLAAMAAHGLSLALACVPAPKQRVCVDHGSWVMHRHLTLLRCSCALLQGGRAGAGGILGEVVEAMVGVPVHITTGGTCHLKPCAATTNPSTLGTNLLHDIDQAAQVWLCAAVCACVCMGVAAFVSVAVREAVCACVLRLACYRTRAASSMVRRKMGSEDICACLGVQVLAGLRGVERRPCCVEGAPYIPALFYICSTTHPLHRTSAHTNIHAQAPTRTRTHACVCARTTPRTGCCQ